MQPSIGLYYPYIHFTNERWLRVAALYWGRMARIVPPDYPLRDSEDVRLLAGELNFVRNVAPSSSVRRKIGAEFRKLVEDKGGILRNRYGVDQAMNWPVDRRSLRAAGLSEADRRLAWIHIDKIDYLLREVLVASNLGSPGRNRDQLWVGMHPRLATVYMSALAEAIGYDNLLSPVTDETVPHLATGGWPMSRLAQALLEEPLARTVGPGSLADALAVATIRYVVPADLDSIPMRRIVEIRRRHAGELDTFRGHVAALAIEFADISRIEDPTLLVDHLNEIYHQKIEPSLRDLKSGLRQSNVDTTLSVMNMQLAAPALLASGAALAGTTVSPIVAAGGGIAIGALPLIRTRRVARRAQANASPVSYLLQVKRNLEPTGAWSRYRDHVRRFLRRDARTT